MYSIWRLIIQPRGPIETKSHKVPVVFFLISIAMQQTWLISILSILNFMHPPDTQSYQQPLAVRSITFEDVRRDTFLTMSSLSIRHDVNFLICAMECMQRSNCRSFNFCRSRYCALLRDDVFSIGVKNQSLIQTRVGCSYYGMRQHFIPFCEENDGWSSSTCGTNQRKVDREWSNWGEERTNTTGNDFYRYRQKVLLVHPAHGDLQCEDNTKIILQHLNIVKVRMNWWSAKSNCDQFGGKLFSDLDGTEDQINKLFSLLQNDDSFWLGLELKSGKYHRVDGGIISEDKIK